jgi:MoaA/NifB/PqqE/SkfB family radical SAM enzyme
MQIDRAVIEINGGCNYKCGMCPQSAPGGRGKDWVKRMSLSQFEDVVAQCAEKGLNVVNLEGSGEPTLNKDLHKYVEIVKKYGAKAFMFSNGFRMRGDYMKQVVDAGVDFYRFSIIGYDKQSYQEMMNSPAFDIICDNVIEMKKYVDEVGSNCTVASYHLITDNDKLEYQKEQYIKLTDKLGTKAEIWKMHNWAGSQDIGSNERSGQIKTCGRPFSPDIVVRAGGLDGQSGAVHPCCQVLGKDDEAVLGHVSENTIEEIWYGQAYEELRQRHNTGDYPSYCAGCDFLLDDPEVMVWTNHERDLYKMHGTEFDLNDYRK